VNRTELIEEVAKAPGLDKRSAEEAVRAVVETVIKQTSTGDKVSIFGFGTFTPTARAARTGRNPQTGDPVKIAASKSVRFAPATAFKASLNPKKKAAAKKAAAAKKSAAPAKAASKTAKASKKK
jgi:DNA-binding protein HU-beta